MAKNKSELVSQAIDFSILTDNELLDKILKRRQKDARKRNARK